MTFSQPQAVRSVPEQPLYSEFYCSTLQKKNDFKAIASRGTLLPNDVSCTGSPIGNNYVTKEEQTAGRQFFSEGHLDEGV